MVNSEQTGRRNNVFSTGTQRGRREYGYGNVTTLKRDKHKEYARYATYCLEMTGMAKDHDARTILREMAAEWLKLADGVLWSRRQQTQMS